MKELAKVDAMLEEGQSMIEIDLTEVKKLGEALLALAEQTEIKTEADVPSGMRVLGTIKEEVKGIEKKFEPALLKVKDAKRRVEDVRKTIEGLKEEAIREYEKAKQIVEAKLREYERRKAEEERARIEAERRRLAEEERARLEKLREAKNAEEAVRLAAEAKEAKRKQEELEEAKRASAIKSAEGVQTRKLWRFRAAEQGLSVSVLPKEYRTIDEYGFEIPDYKKIQAEVNAKKDATQIAGVVVYYELSFAGR